MKKVSVEELKGICDKHIKWIRNEEGGERADLYGVNLSRADLSGAALYGVNLSRADLYEANLSRANLSGADLYEANLYGADLYEANLSGANLSGANLYGADLSGADLYGANLSGADLYGADLSRANRAELAWAQTRIVPEGIIIGWKKIKCSTGTAIAKLRIPEEAKRSNSASRKCRAEWAIVLEIIGAKSGWSSRSESFLYEVGEEVRPDKWDENRWDECSNGIHFFITREEAEAYDL